VREALRHYQHSSKVPYVDFWGVGILVVVIGTAVALFSSVFTQVALCVTLALLAACVGVISLIRTEAAFCFVLLVRSSLDNAAEMFTLFEGTPYRINLNGVLNLYVIFLAIVMLAKNSWRVPYKSRVIWSFLFLLLCLVSAFYHVQGAPPMLTIRETVRFVSYLAVFISAVYLGYKEKQFGRVIWALALSTIVPMAFNIHDLIWGSPYYYDANRLQSTFWHPNVNAFFQMCVFLVLLGTWRHIPNRWMRWLSVIWAGLTLVMLFRTGARAALVGTLVALGVYFVFRTRSLMRYLPFLICIAILSASVVLPRFQQLFDPNQRAATSIEEVYSVNSFQSRLWLWPQIWNAAVQRPLLGYGWGTWTSYFSCQFLEGFECTEGNDAWAAHNDYLKLFFEVGIIGLILYLAWIFGISTLMFRIMRRSRGQWSSDMALVLLGLTMAQLVAMLTDNLMAYTAVQWLFYALVGLVAGRYSAMLRDKRVTAL
jgi:O-antigen ligase